ncbi:hypothetical protein MKX08_004628, partial [Trichoderma sp. CBMAI-0020]
DRKITWLALCGAVDSRVSPRTIRRALQRVYKRKWKSAQRIMITEKTAEARLQFCQAWEGKEEELVETLFSDEATAQNKPNNRRGWVFRAPGERFNREIVNVTIHGKVEISLMVWGGIWRGGRTPLVIMERDPDAPRGGYSSKSYQNALSEGLLSVYDGTRLFQQDNARIHNFGGTPEWLQLHGIAYIDWPPHSPDLNPIEHIWSALKKKLSQICPELRDLRRNRTDIALLKQKIKEAWDLIDQDLIDTLVESMPRRLAAVRAAQGYYTRY